MERPDRVIVDLPEVAFHLPAETGRKQEGLIASYRYGLFAPGRSRVVMELAQPAVVSGIDHGARRDGRRHDPDHRALPHRAGGVSARRLSESSAAAKEASTAPPVQETKDASAR